MNWVFGNWHESLEAPWSYIAMALVAVACGAVVGAERERKAKGAGLRTMMLVSFGAALFTMVSFGLAGSHSDRSRIAAQIVTGVGFLGAGAILRGPTGVQGLTTAASIWVVAATGMVCGAGYPAAGLAASVLVLALLLGTATLEKRFLGACKLAQVVVVFDHAGGKGTVKVEEILNDYQISHERRRFDRAQDDLIQCEFTYCYAHKHHREFLTKLAGLSEIREIRTEGARGPLAGN